MGAQDTVAVIGAGVVGTAIALALSREGNRVLLLDRADPGVAGASYGNIGHIAAELIQPLPSLALLFGFWHERFSRGGALDMPPRRLWELTPWFTRFAAAAFHRHANTRHLEPLVRPASAAMRNWLGQIGRSDLLRQHGHYEIWLGSDASRRAARQANRMQRLDIRTEPVAVDLLQRASDCAGGQAAAGRWFPNSGHVIDPLEIVRAFAAAALERGARFIRTEVHAIEPHDAHIELATSNGPIKVDKSVVCAGAWSAPLLEPLGLRVPLQSVRGYHIEIPGHAPLTDAPVLYVGEHVLVTPMSGRLRASSYMEFLPPEAAPDFRKPARLREQMRRLGYRCDLEGASWVGSRPVFPDYLPGIGRLPQTQVFYAIGHQHIGLTIAPITAELIADLVADRPARHRTAAFDLRRFGLPGRMARLTRSSFRTRRSHASHRN